jgi:hypothetical protein
MGPVLCACPLSLPFPVPAPCEFPCIPLALHDVKWEPASGSLGEGFILADGGNASTIVVESILTSSLPCFEFNIPDMVYVPFPDPALQRLTIQTQGRIIPANPLDRAAYIIMTTGVDLVEFSEGKYMKLLYIPYNMNPTQYYNFSRYMWSFSFSRMLNFEH